MNNRVGLCLVGVIAGAVACGGASRNDFGDPIAASGHGGASGSMGNASGGTTGGTSDGGTSGSTTGGSGATATGGSGGDAVAAGGTAGDFVAAGGTAGDVMAAGGMAGEPASTGGTAGDTATGGTAGDTATGGTAGDTATGGTAGDTATGGAGNAGGTTGGSAGKPSTGGTAGMPNCAELDQQYAETLEAAQACNAGSGKEQCTELVPGSLTCGCDVFANRSNADALAELERLRKQGLRCMTACLAIACVPPERGTCLQDLDGPKGSGHCVTGVAGGPL